jgi:hypothetical protein
VFDPPVYAEFRPEELPSTLELVMPSCTIIDVRVAGPDGAPWPEPALVTLTKGGGRAFWDSLSQSKLTSTGRASFERVGVGIRVLGRARGAHFEQAEDARARSAGAAHERAEITIRVEREPLWRMRLEMPDGTPCNSVSGRGINTAGVTRNARP